MGSATQLRRAARSRLWCVAVVASAAVRCMAQEQYPPPLTHTPTNHPAARVLLLSIDGLHAVDLANWVASHPHSALAELSARGVTYTNAHAPMANGAAGLLALTTGGTPISTGILSGGGYDRDLSPPGLQCKARGAKLKLDAMFGADGEFDPSKAPRDPARGCAPMAPHDLLRVNTIFEVVREKIGETAWAGEDAATTDLLRGPSGKGLTRSYMPRKGAQSERDSALVDTVLRWIDGRDESGAPIAVPTLFGMSFACVAEGQVENGYVDPIGTPSPGLVKALEFVDGSIGRMVRELQRQGLYDSTWIAVVAPYGQSPMDVRRRRVIPLARVQAVAETGQPGMVAHIIGGDAVMIWLRDASQTAAVVKTLGDHATELGAAEIDSGARLALTLNPPAKDTRMPDIILHADYGVMWTSAEDKALATTGGALDEDTHVALLISGKQLTGRTDPTYVPTTQLGPLLLRALGMEKFDLQALHKEHSPALPGIF